MALMRAKLKAFYVREHFYGKDGAKSGEEVSFHAVAASKYPEDGSDEDNTFAKWTPSANLSIQITNPALLDLIKVGDEFYVDFTPVNEKEV